MDAPSGFRYFPGSMVGGRLFPGEAASDREAENKNTKRKTETDMRIFTAYLVSVSSSDFI